jgi:adenylate cyclase
MENQISSVARVYLETSSKNDNQTLALDRGNSWTIGRVADNTLVLNDNAMSRRHAIIQLAQPGQFYFIDLGSSNGSTVNGRRVTTPVELGDGDSIVCGETHLIFHNPGSKLASPTVPDEDETVPHKVERATTVLYPRRLITVLVVDIRDFTPLARQVNEKILAQTIGTWFRHVGTTVKRYGASGDKYIGDAVMAVWTHDTERTKQTEIYCVLEALSEIEALSKPLHEQFSLPLPLRVGAGINTGVSIISNTGPQGNPDFSPLGDSVNAAFRLETATKGSGFDIALGRTTVERLGDMTEIQRYFENRLVALKGYEQPVEAWLTSFANLESFLSSRSDRRQR